MCTKFKRLAAWILCFSMIAGLIPAWESVPATMAQAAGTGQTYTFTNAAVDNPRNATLEAQGWRLHPTLTSRDTYITNTAWVSNNAYAANLLIKQVNNTPVESDVAIEFRVDQAGEYNLKLDYRTISAGIPTDVYLDGEKIGSVNFYANSGSYSDASTDFDGITTYFEAGSEHVFTIRRTGGSDYCIYLSRLHLVSVMPVTIDGAKAVECGGTVSIKAYGKDGSEVTSGVSYTVEPEDIVSVADDGTVTGLADGVAMITATISNGAEELVSAPYEIKVISAAGKAQTIGFEGSIYQEIRDATVESNGFAINKAKTSVASYSTNPSWIKWRDWGFDVYIDPANKPIESDLSMDFKVNEDGLYKIGVKHMKHVAGATADVYVDGMLIGSMDFYADAQKQNQKEYIGDKYIALNQGVHNITFRRTGGKDHCYYMEGLILSTKPDVVISGPTAVKKGESFKIDVIDQNGDVITSDVTYAVSEDGIVSVADDGTVTGLANGAVEITATAIVDGVSITSKGHTVKVIAEGGKNHNISFRANISENPRDVKIADKGWEINKEKTAVGSYTTYPAWLNYSGTNGITAYINAANNPPESDLSFDIMVEADGLYNVSVEYWKNVAGCEADVYLDGVKIGSVDFYGQVEYGLVAKMGDDTIALDKGIHNVTFRRTGGKDHCPYLSAILLKPDITGISFDCSDIIPVNYPVKLKVIDQGGDAVDADVSYTIVPENLISVDADGNLVGKAAGTASVTASIVVGGKTITSPAKEITVVAEDGEYTKIDFRGDIYSEIRDAKLETNGFEINKEKTCRQILDYGPWLEWENYGFAVYMPNKDTPVDSDVAIDFYVEKTGVYLLELEYVINAAGNLADIYIDDEYIGEIDFYNTSFVEGKRFTFLDKKLALSEGRHTMIFRRTSKSKFECIHPSAIILRAPLKVFVSADKDVLECGETTQLNLSGPWFEDAENLPKAEDIFYDSSDLSVLEINESGQVIAKNAGTATVTATVFHNGKSDSHYMQMTVTDDTPITSALLSADKSMYVNNQMPLKVEIIRESGDVLNNSAAEIFYHVVSCEPADAISVTADGQVKAIAPGTAQIKATVSANGITKETNVITVTATEMVIPDGEYANHVFNFMTNQISEPEDSTLASHGWQLNRALSSSELIKGGTAFSWNSSYGMMSYTPSSAAPESDTTLDFIVKADGIYRGKFVYMADPKGGNYNVYVDEQYMGSFSTYSEIEYEKNVEAILNSMYLEKGVHKVTFRFVSGNPYLYMSSFNLLTVANPSPAEFMVDVDKTTLSVGEIINTKLGIIENGMAVKFGKPYTGSSDPNNYMNIVISDTGVLSYDANTGKIIALKEGTCTISVEGKRGDVEGKDSVDIVVDSQKLGAVSIDVDPEEVNKGHTAQLSITAFTTQNREITAESLDVVWSTSDESKARIEDGKLICVGVGEFDVIATASLNGTTVVATKTMSIGVAIGSELEVKLATYMLKPEQKGVQMHLNGKLSDGTIVSLTAADATYENLNPEVVNVSPSGFVSPVGLGKADITITATVAGAVCEKTITVMVTTGKTASTIYTAEKVEAARTNANAYNWARNERNAAVAYADLYLGKSLDEIWSSVTPQSLMRNATPTIHRSDPSMGVCYYCGSEINAKYGHYPWLVDHFNDPWKMQCPDCRRKFPSNDFDSFYKLGIDEYGNWDYQKALDENAKIVEEGGKGYLVNLLYPEIETVQTVNRGKGLYETETVEGWGVDDGYGYDTGKEFAAGQYETHAYVAYINHWGVWYNGANMYTTGAYIPAMLTSFMKAYMYTGDIKYGRAGAILIDRVADVYPDMDHKAHHESWHTETTPIAGKVTDHIWGTNHARHFAEYYDAFFPAMDDPMVISFLSNKAAQYSLENTKEDAFEIRRNCEDNLVRATYSDIVNGYLQGNFGMHQNAMATAAVVLDNGDETREMIDWIFRTNTGRAWWKDQTTGGDFYRTMMNTVSRDGIGDEASPGYNYLWVTNNIPIADVLAGYEGYEAADLYKNAKFVKLLLGELPLVMARRYTPDIGDDGAGAANIGISFSKNDMIKAFINTGMKEFAQAAYMLNGNTSAGLRGDIYSTNPEGVADAVQAVIDEYGEYQFVDESIQLSEYGISILRDGGYHVNASGVVNDNQRDWWIYYGKGRGHGHPDALNLGMDAFGLNIAPEMGYPTSTSGDEYLNWNHTTISHNTVTVNNTSQYGLNMGMAKPMHFDDSDVVKVMDVDASAAYDTTSIYRRTHVVVKVDDDNSYSVDFFRVKGGNDHVYSFHSQSQNVDVQGVSMREQKGGTYAGTSVEWKTGGYTNGYNYMYNVSRASAPGTGEFTADFDVDDIYGILKQDRDIHVRMTMLNDFNLTEVATADGPTPDVGCPADSFRYVLARRSGRNLDSLFTAVYEPYDGTPYLTSRISVPVTRVGGEEESLIDKAKAVKVEHADGRVDYIVYASNNRVEYEVNNLFKFKGFVGVYSTINGSVLCKYILDGEFIDDVQSTATVEGTVKSFTQDLVLKNEIVVDFDSAIDASILNGKYVDVANGMAKNAVYRIWNAENIDEDTVRLDINDTTLVNGYVDPIDIYGGYNFNIATGNRVSIPLSKTVDNRVTISQVEDVRATAGRQISITVRAESPSGDAIVFSGNNLPRGAIVDAETGLFEWTPDSRQIGKYDIGINAESGGSTSTMYFSVEVVKSSSGSGSTSGGASDVTPSTPDTPSTPSAPGGGGAGGGGGSATPSTPSTPAAPTTPDAPATGEGEGTGDAPETPAEKFVDLGNHTWAEDAIYTLVDKGVVNGTSANTYAPANNIKRADFAIMLVRAFGITEGEGENFADVDSNKYYAEELRLAKAAGIVNGVGNDKFNPEGEITRQDMMLMLSRALDAMEVELSDADLSALADFADAAQISDYAADAVSRMIKDGIIAGSNGKINPLAKATRAEIAVMLDRVLSE